MTHASRAWELVVETTTQPLLFELALPSPPPSASMQPSLPPTPLLPLPAPPPLPPSPSPPLPIFACTATSPLLLTDRFT